MITKALETGSLEKLISFGITESHFKEDDCRALYHDAVEHLRRFKAPPSTQAMRAIKAHEEFAWEPSRDSLDYLINEFIKEVKRRTAIESMREMARLIDESPENIDELYLESARHLSRTIPSVSTSRFSDQDNRTLTYEQLAASGEEIRGLPFGIPTIDNLTFGIQNHELVSIIGFAGCGKSTLLQHIFFSQYMAGFTPLIVSLEMEASALLRKFDTMGENFEYRALKSCELTQEEIDRWKQSAERAKQAPNDIIILDDIGRHCTVDRVYAEANRYRPDIIGIDYVSLMKAPRETGQIWQDVTQLTNELKLMARDLKIPIVAVAQTNRESYHEGAGIQNISYSKSVSQDSDIILALNDFKGELKAKQQMEIKLDKNRDGPKSKIMMYWNMSNMEFREWKESDMFTRRLEVVPNEEVIPA